MKIGKYITGLGIFLSSLVSAQERINPSMDLVDFFNTHSNTTVISESGHYGGRDKLNLEGITLLSENPVDLTDIDISRDFGEITGAYSVFNNRFYLSNSAIEGIVIDNNHVVIRDNSSLRKSIVKNYGTGIIIDEGYSNINIDGNLIFNHKDSLGKGKGISFEQSQSSTDKNIYVRNNIIADNDWGVKMEGFGDLGNDGYDGNNILMNRINVYNAVGEFIPAINNWWYRPKQDKTDGNQWEFLDNYDDILSTIVNLNPEQKTTQESWTEFVPFHDQDFFEQQQYEQPMSNDNWGMYK